MSAVIGYRGAQWRPSHDSPDDGRFQFFLYLSELLWYSVNKENKKFAAF